MEIFERELDEFTEQMQSRLKEVDDPRDRLERLFRCYVEFGEENEFIQQAFLRQDYRDVLGDISSEQLTEIERNEMAALIPPIEDIQTESGGPISEMEPITVLGLIGSSLGMLVLHKDEYEEYSADIEEIQDGIYDHLQEEMISTLARGLTVED